MMAGMSINTRVYQLEIGCMRLIELHVERHSHEAVHGWGTEAKLYCSLYVDLFNWCGYKHR